MAGDGIEEAQRWLTEYFQQAEGISSPVRRRKAARRSSIALPPPARQSAIRRCMPTKSKIFWRWISPCAVTMPSGWIAAGDRDVYSWCISSTMATLCAMCSIRLHRSGKGRRPRAEGKMLELLKARGAQYPAEHNGSSMSPGEPAAVLSPERSHQQHEPGDW